VVRLGGHHRLFIDHLPELARRVRQDREPRRVRVGHDFDDRLPHPASGDPVRPQRRVDRQGNLSTPPADVRGEGQVGPVTRRTAQALDPGVESQADQSPVLIDRQPAGVRYPGADLRDDFVGDARYQRRQPVGSRADHLKGGVARHAFGAAHHTRTLPAAAALHHILGG